MFDRLKRYFLGESQSRAGGSPGKAADTQSSADAVVPFGPRLTSARTIGAGALEHGRFFIFLYDNLQAVGTIQYAYMLVVRDTRQSVLYVTAEVATELGQKFGSKSHVLGVFDAQSHSNYGDSDDWGDPAKFFPKAIELAAARLGVDPSSALIQMPGAAGNLAPFEQWLRAQAW